MTGSRISRWFHGDMQERSPESWDRQIWDRDPSTSSLNEAGPGIYFTSSMMQASTYGPYLYECRRRDGSRRPTIIRALEPASIKALLGAYNLAEKEEKERFLADWQAKEPRDVLTMFCRRTNLHDALLGLYGPSGVFRDATSWVQAMRTIGYDAAIKSRTYGIKHLVIWNPECFRITLRE